MWFLFLGILLLMVGCGGSSGRMYEEGDFRPEGKVMVERVLQSFPPSTLTESCYYIYGLEDCPEYSVRINNCIYESFGRSPAIDSLLLQWRISLVITDLISEMASENIQEYFYNEDSSLTDLRLISHDVQVAPLLRTSEGIFPGKFIGDSIKYYGSCHFNSLGKWSFLLKEEWLFEAGKPASKKIVGLEIGLNSRVGNRFHSFAKVDMRDWAPFFGQRVSQSFGNSSTAWPSPLFSTQYPYEDLSIQSAYDHGNLFLYPSKVDGKWVDEKAALSLMSKDIHFQPHVPPASELKGSWWLACHFFDPQPAFQMPKERLELALNNGSFNLTKQLEGVFGAFTHQNDYRENILLSYSAKPLFKKALKEVLLQGKLPLYNPDSVTSSPPKLHDWASFDAMCKKHAAIYDLEIEFLVKINMDKGTISKDLPFIRVVVSDPTGKKPMRNMCLLKWEDFVQVLEQPLPPTSISLGEFFQKYAFMEVYNLNGRGARTHQQAKDYFALFEILQPQPLPHE